MTVGYVPQAMYTSSAPVYNAVKIDVHNPVMNAPAQPTSVPVFYTYPTTSVYPQPEQDKVQ